MTEGPSTSEQVTFLHPFLLSGMDKPHPPGTFEVWTDRQAIDVSWWPAYLESTRILLRTSGGVESIQLKREELDRALALDAATTRAP